MGVIKKTKDKIIEMYKAGYTCEEIADIIGMPEQTKLIQNIVGDKSES